MRTRLCGFDSNTSRTTTRPMAPTPPRTMKLRLMGCRVGCPQPIAFPLQAATTVGWGQPTLQRRIEARDSSGRESLEKTSFNNGQSFLELVVGDHQREQE